MADKWGGEEIRPVEFIRRNDGDAVFRFTSPSGDAIIIFAYSDQSPQIIKYPNLSSSIEAFNTFRKNFE